MLTDDGLITYNYKDCLMDGFYFDRNERKPCYLLRVQIGLPPKSMVTTRFSKILHPFLEVQHK